MPGKPAERTTKCYVHAPLHNECSPHPPCYKRNRNIFCRTTPYKSRKVGVGSATLTRLQPSHSRRGGQAVRPPGRGAGARRLDDGGGTCGLDCMAATCRGGAKGGQDRAGDAWAMRPGDALRTGIMCQGLTAISHLHQHVKLPPTHSHCSARALARHAVGGTPPTISTRLRAHCSPSPPSALPCKRASSASTTRAACPINHPCRHWLPLYAQPAQSPNHLCRGEARRKDARPQHVPEHTHRSPCSKGGNRFAPKLGEVEQAGLKVAQAPRASCTPSKRTWLPLMQG